MRLKQLESHLSQVQGFESPSYDLEQIATNAHLAANIIMMAHSKGDVSVIAIVRFACISITYRVYIYGIDVFIDLYIYFLD